MTGRDPFYTCTAARCRRGLEHRGIDVLERPVFVTVPGTDPPLREARHVECADLPGDWLHLDGEDAPTMA